MLNIFTTTTTGVGFEGMTPVRTDRGPRRGEDYCMVEIRFVKTRSRLIGPSCKYKLRLGNYRLAPIIHTASDTHTLIFQIHINSFHLRSQTHALLSSK